MAEVKEILDLIEGGTLTRSDLVALYKVLDGKILDEELGRKLKLVSS